VCHGFERRPERCVAHLFDDRPRDADRFALEKLHRLAAMASVDERLDPRRDIDSQRWYAVGVDGPRRHRCARLRSLQIAGKETVRGTD